MFLPRVLLGVPKTLHLLILHSPGTNTAPAAPFCTKSWIQFGLGSPSRMTETCPLFPSDLCNSPHQSHCICSTALFPSNKSKNKGKERKEQWQRAIACQSEQKSKTYQEAVWTLTNRFTIPPSSPGILTAPGFCLSQRALLVLLKDTISRKTSGARNWRSRQGTNLHKVPSA